MLQLVGKSKLKSKSENSTLSFFVVCLSFFFILVFCRESTATL